MNNEYPPIQLRAPKICEVRTGVKPKKGRLTPVQKKRIAFEKELKDKPATTEELWIALQCLADDYVSARDHMDPCLDYLQSARKLLDSINNPGELIPFEEIQRKMLLQESEDARDE